MTDDAEKPAGRFEELDDEIAAQEEELDFDEPHYTRIPARCPKCPPGEGNLEITDSTTYAVDRVAMDVHCDNCGYEGNAITRLTDLEDKHDGFQSAVENGDLPLKYERY